MLVINTWQPWTRDDAANFSKETFNSPALATHDTWQLSSFKVTPPVRSGPDNLQIYSLLLWNDTSLSLSPGPPLYLTPTSAFGFLCVVIFHTAYRGKKHARARYQSCQVWPKNKFGLFSNLVGLEIFDNLLSRWPYFRSIKVSIVKSKMLPFLKQRLAFVSYKHLATLRPLQMYPWRANRGG